jgi:uncharacterized membrane protein YccC
MSAERKASWAGFVLWALVGALFGFATVSFIVIAFIPAIVILILAITRKNLIPSGWGVLAGLGSIPVLVAYIQRQGPGTVCTYTPTETSCQDYLNPLPWLIAGLAMVAVGVGGQFIRMKRDRHETNPARNSDLR